MDLNKIAKLLANIKPLDEQKADLERQISKLNRDDLAMLSPLINQVRELNPKMNPSELIAKADEIKQALKDANRNFNN